MDIQALSRLVNQFLQGTGGGPTPAWSQAAWYIDPSNSTGLASDANDGLTVLTPILTFKQIVNRWGTATPTLYQGTTFNFLSDQPDFNDPIFLSANMGTPTGSGTIAINGSPVQVGAGTLNVAQAKNKATGARWHILANGAPANFWAPFVGYLVHDTTQDCYFWVDEDLGGGVALITEPLGPHDSTTLNPPMVTPVNGDAFVVLRPTKLFMPYVMPQVASGTTPYIQGVWLTSAPGPFGLFNQLLANFAFFAESRMDGYVTNLGPEADVIFTNCLFRGGANLCQGTVIGGAFHMPGGFSGLSIGAGGLVLLDGDVCVEDFLGAGGNLVFGTAYLSPAADIPRTDYQPGLACSVVISQNAGFYGAGTLWGPGAIHIHPAGYGGVEGTTFTAAYLCAGALALDGQATASAYDTATGLWHPGRALTPANLDLAVAGGGFGGIAYGALGDRIGLVV
jgi:hypothetical protein